MWEAVQMFRENKEHLYKSMFCTIDSMDPRYAKEIEDGWAGLFYKHVFCQIDETIFEPLYSKDTGRPNTPVNILASLEIIKHLWNYTDEQLFRTIRSDYEVNFALGIRELGSYYIADRTVYDFREKLISYALENPEKGSLIFDLFQHLTANFIDTLGINSSDIRMDSTLIEPNIKKAGRLALVFDVLCLALKIIPNTRLPQSLQKVLEPGFQKNMLYQAKSEKLASNLECLLNLAEEALEIASEIPEVCAKEEIKTLVRLIDEQTYIDENSKQRKVKPNSEISATSLQSAYDTDATYRAKGKKVSSGYVVNIAETCEKDNPVQMIVDYAVEKNTTSDQKMMKESLPKIKENTDVKRVYVDGGYFSTEEWQKAHTNHVDIVFTNMTGSQPDPSKIPFSKFRVDIENKKVLSCPAGQKPTFCSFTDGSYSLRFDIHVCKNCPLAAQCPVVLRKSYSIVSFSEKSYLASLIKAKYMTSEEIQKNISMRAGVEGSISGLKVGQRISELWVRGQEKVEYYIEWKALAANVKRFCRGVKELIKNNKPLQQGRSVPTLAS